MMTSTGTLPWKIPGTWIRPLVVFSLLLFGTSQAKVLQAQLVTIDTPLTEGIQSVTGTLIEPAPANTQVQVTLTSNDGVIENKKRGIAEGSSTYMVETNRPLTRPLKVKVTLWVSNLEKSPSQEVDVQAPEAPKISTPLLEGTKVVSGTAPPNTSVKVVVTLNGQDLDSHLVKLDPGKTAFSVNTVPLIRPMKVKATLVVNELELSQFTEAEIQAPAGIYDWGRVRANFTLGAILSEENAQFSETAPYLDFIMDSNWLRKQFGCTGTNSCASEEPERGGWLFNTFFDARLSSIAVTPDKITPPADPPAVPPADPPAGDSQDDNEAF